jgi:hypothetical protein
LEFAVNVTGAQVDGADAVTVNATNGSIAVTEVYKGKHPDWKASPTLASFGNTTSEITADPTAGYPKKNGVEGVTAVTSYSPKIDVLFACVRVT